MWDAQRVSSSPDKVPRSAWLVGLGVLAVLGLLVRLADTGPVREPARTPPVANASTSERTTSETKSEDLRREDERRTRDRARVEENIVAQLPQREDPEVASLCGEVTERGIQSVAPDFARSVEISYDAAVVYIQEVCAVVPAESPSAAALPSAAAEPPPVRQSGVVVVGGESLDMSELREYLSGFSTTSWYPLIEDVSADSSTVTVTTSLDGSGVPGPAQTICGAVSILTLDGGEGWLPTTVTDDEGAVLARSTGSGPCSLQ